MATRRAGFLFFLSYWSSMDYRQFLRSAERHLQICKLLLDTYDKAKDARQKSNILSEVYYLSGYVLETGLSYAFFSHIKHAGDIYLSSHFNNNCFKTHRVLQKYEYMMRNSCTINGLVFVSVSHQRRDLQQLFTQWDVKFRYEHHAKLNKEVMNIYIAEIEKGLITIKIQYPL